MLHRHLPVVASEAAASVRLSVSIKCQVFIEQLDMLELRQLSNLRFCQYMMTDAAAILYSNDADAG